MKPPSLLFISILFISCAQSTNNNTNPNGTTIKTRFVAPEGYERVSPKNNSYAEYLQNLPLKPDDTKVKYYNGETKPNRGVYDTVIDIEIGNRNLQQCADAVMRLRGEYLYSTKQYDAIHFNFTNGFRVDYAEYMKGKRMIVDGNKTYWRQSSTPSNTYTDFRKYMDLIFTYAGTLSLSKELKPVSLNDIQIGDVFIQGGSPGHAVTVVDMAISPKTGDKLFLLAQSYMPAQDIQILKNPNNSKLSPWYSNNFSGDLRTPEWSFNSTDLVSWKKN